MLQLGQPAGRQWNGERHPGLIQRVLEVLAAALLQRPARQQPGQGSSGFVGTATEKEPRSYASGPASEEASLFARKARRRARS
jgi:hypothetical protein